MSAKLTCLCVDDDPMALDQVRQMIAGIDVDLDASFFGSPTSALQAYEANPVDIVISDLKMGSISGIQLIEKMQRHENRTIFILLSGEADLNSALQALNKINVFRFLTKPSTREELGTVLFEAVRERNLIDLREFADATVQAMEQSNRAVARVDVNGRILFANGPAKILIENSNFFKISRDAKLKVTNNGDMKDFLALLQSVADVASSSGDANELYRFCDDHLAYPIVVAVSADRKQAQTLTLMFFDPNQRNTVSAEKLMLALGITRSEARIVHALIEEGNLEDGATAMGVSINTARTYLKNVFNKTGTCKQAELVRLALASTS